MACCIFCKEDLSESHDIYDCGGECSKCAWLSIDFVSGILDPFDLKGYLPSEYFEAKYNGENMCTRCFDKWNSTIVITVENLHNLHVQLGEICNSNRQIRVVCDHISSFIPINRHLCKIIAEYSID